MSAAEYDWSFADPSDVYGRLCAAQAALSRVRKLQQRLADDESTTPLQRLTRHMVSIELAAALEGK